MTPIRLNVDFNNPIDITNFTGEGFLYAKDGQFYLGTLYTEWCHRAKSFYDDNDSVWKTCPINGKPMVVLDKDENIIE